MDENDIKKVKLGYFGNASPDYYNVDYEYLWSHNRIDKPIDYKQTVKPAKGIIAVSATSLQTIGYWDRKNRRYIDNPAYSYDWLKKYQPIEIVGNSILLYNIH